MRKKILIFSLAYYPKHIGGAEVAIKEITDRIPPEDYEWHLVCNRYDSTLPKEERVGNVHVHRIGIVTKEPSMSDLRKLPLHLNKPLYQFQAYWVAKRLHRHHRFDGIWAMMAHATGVPAAKFKRRFPGMKYVLTLQEGDPSEQVERQMRWFGRDFDDAFLRADVIQSISTYLNDWAARKGHQGKRVIIPNAVNTKHFSHDYSEETLAGVKAELGKQEGDVFLVTTSRLVRKNGVDTVIQALPQLPSSVKFVIFGTGPQEEELKALAEELGVKERVQFRGFIEHAVMPKYLKACDIFIRPSRSEGMGNSFLEAMASELPVIATQEGGIADFLFDETRDPEKETTGWAVDANSPAQIKEAVEDILARPEKMAQVTARAKAMAEDEYDWDLIASRMKKEVFDPLF